MRILIGSMMMSLVALSAVGCGKKESPAAASGTTTAAPKPAESAKPAAEPSAPIPSTTPAASSQPQEYASSPPTNFSGAEAVKNAIAVGLGCEARAKEGWLELLCRKKNGTGGHPKTARTSFHPA